jgi:hypothetical protein
MNRLHPAILGLVALLSAGLGYRTAVHRHAPPAVGAREVIPATEYFARPKSFSEVENARAELDASVLRTLFEIRSRRAYSLSHPSPAGQGSGPDAALERDIGLLEDAVTQLRGTGGDLVIVRDLLAALKQAGHLQRWLDLYLDTLHRQPTTEFVAVLARDACRIGAVLGREEEVIAGLHLVLANPLATVGRDRIVGVLDGKEESPIPTPATGAARPSPSDSPEEQGSRAPGTTRPSETE